MKINKMLAHSSNFTKGRKSKIEFIVIHYTGNNGDRAISNCNFFKKPNRNASAHYFVDEDEIWQSVLDEDIAWHCGTKNTYYHNKCRNSNSIGVELCSEKDINGNFYFNEKTLNNAINFIKFLMQKYNIPIQNILRHYDITHKICPAPFVNNEKAWINFRNNLVEGDEKYMYIKSNYEYNGKIESFNVINYEGSNYIRVRDLAEFLNKNIVYDNNTKITKLNDTYNKVKIEVKEKNEECDIKAINSHGNNYVPIRELCEKIGYNVLYEEKTKKIILEHKTNNKLKNLFKR